MSRLIKRFSINKIIQLLAYIQEKSHINNYLKLIKLLFFADRYSLRTYGVPLTYDQYQAMRYGPVCSNTYDVIKKEDMFISSVSAKERKLIEKSLQKTDKYSIEFLKPVNEKMLSISDKDSLDFAIANFGNISPFALASISHDYPEWKKYAKELNSGEVKRETMSYEDFFDDPDLDESPAITKWFNGIDPFAMDKEDLQAIKNFYLLNR